MSDQAATVQVPDYDLFGPPIDRCPNGDPHGRLRRDAWKGLPDDVCTWCERRMTREIWTWTGWRRR